MSAPNRSALCDLLGVCYPVVQAPMAGGWTTPELVAGVSGAGGFGVLAGARTASERHPPGAGAYGPTFRGQLPALASGRGGRDVAGVQRFLDRFRRELGLLEGSVEFVREYLKGGPEPLEYPLQRAAAQDIFAAARERDEGDYAQMLAGQGLRMLREERGAAEIVAGVVEEAGRVLSRLAG